MEINSGRVDRRSLIAGAATVLLWASAFVVIRDVGEYFSPGALALGRLVSAFAVLALFLLVRGQGWPPRAAWPGILILGLLWFGVYMVALNWGEQEVDAGTAAMIINIGPILIALLSGWLLKEGFPPRVLAGIGVSFAGTVVVGYSLSGGGSASILGLLLCVLAAVSYSVAVLYQKSALRHASALQVTTFGCLIGLVACLPFAGQLVAEVAEAPVPATLNMIYLGVFPTGLAFTTWAYALARTTAARMGATTYVVPALVVLLSWLLLAEVPGWLSLAGGLLCLAGVAISRSGARPPRDRGATGEPAAPLRSHTAG